MLMHIRSVTNFNVGTLLFNGYAYVIYNFGFFSFHATKDLVIRSMHMCCRLLNIIIAI
jgi:hypothetical protein